MASDKEQSLESFRIFALPPDFYYIPNFITVEEETSILQKIPAQRWITLSHRRLQAHPSTLTKNNTLLAAPLPPYLVTPVVDRFNALGIFEHTLHQTPNHVLINEYKKGEGIMPHEDGNAYAEVVATVSLGAAICLDITAKPDENSKESEKGPTTNKEQDADVTLESDEALPRSESRSGSSTYSLPTRILQEPRSLLITKGPAYGGLLHGITPIDTDEGLNAETVANWNLLAQPQLFEDAGANNERGTRVSLTYRDVLKVSTAASKVFGGIGKR